MAITTPSQPELEAHAEAMRASQSALAAGLRELLGVRLVAVIAGVRETQAVHEWAEGTREIRNPEVLPRLRLAYLVARMISEAESLGVAQAWMQGLNPHLGDRSPALVLRESTVEQQRQDVFAAARAFVATG